MQTPRNLVLKWARFTTILAIPYLSTDIPSSLAHGESIRSARAIGFHLGTLSDPFPAIAGGSLALNITDYLRVTASFGLSRWEDYSYTFSSDVGDATVGDSVSPAYGAGVKFLAPGRNPSPSVGLNISHISQLSTGTFSLLGQTRATPSQGGTTLYVNAGIEWITDFGLQVGTGINFPFIGPLSNFVSPYLQLGFMLNDHDRE